ncbi:hypothetical protein FOZ62_027438, partial [Perkinsus olseni]
GVFGSSRDAIENDNEEKDLNPADLAVVVVSGLVRPVRPAAVTRLLTNNSSVRIVREWTEPAKKSFAVVEYYDEGTARRMGRAIQDTKWNQEHRLVVDFLRRSQFSEVAVDPKAPPEDRKRGGSSPEGADESRKRHSGTTSSRTREVDKREIEEMVEKQRVLSELRNHKFLPATSAASNTTLLWMPCTHKQTEKLQAQVSKNGGKFPTIPAPADYPAVAYHARPLVPSGNWATPTDPFRLRKCLSGRECPGGPIGDLCSDHRLGLVCALCDSGFYHSGGGCAQCSGSDSVILPLVILLIIVVYHLTYNLMNREVQQAVTADVSIAMSIGSLVTYLQLIALFSEIGFDWSSEISTLLDIAKISLFNFDILRLECFMDGSQQSLWRYLTGFALPYAIIMSVGRQGYSDSRFFELASSDFTHCFGLVYDRKIDPNTASDVCLSVNIAADIYGCSISLPVVPIATPITTSETAASYGTPTSSAAPMTIKQIMVAVGVVSSVLIIVFLLFCYQLNRWAGDELSGERGAAFSVRYRFLFYRL